MGGGREKGSTDDPYEGVILLSFCEKKIISKSSHVKSQKSLNRSRDKNSADIAATEVINLSN